MPTGDALPPNDSRPLSCDGAGPPPDDTHDGGPTHGVNVAAVHSKLDEIAADLAPTMTELASLVDDLITPVESDMHDTAVEVNAAVADMVGTVDAALTEVLYPVITTVDKIANTAAATMDRVAADLIDSGVNYPTDPALQSQLLNDGDAELITDALPWLADPPPDEVGLPCDPTDPRKSCATDIPFPPPPPPDPPPPPTSPPADAGECVFRTVYPVKDGDPPAYTGYVNSVSGLPCAPESPPPPPPPPDAVCPAPVCVPPAVTINVTDACGNVVGFPIAAAGAGGTTVGTPIPPPPPPVSGGIVGPPITPAPPPPPPITDSQLPDVTATATCANWDVSDLCKVGEYSVSLPTPTGSESYSDVKKRWWMEDVLKFANGVMTITMPGYAAIKAGVNLVAGHDGLEAWATTAHVGSKLATDLIDTLTGNCVAEKGTVARLAVLLGTANWTETITGAPMRYLSQSNIYQFQYLNPQFLPAQADADNLYLRGKITDQTWECLTKAQGNLPQWHRAARNAKQALMTPNEITQAWRRGYISDRDYTDMLTENGMVNANYQVLTQMLSELPLTPGDIVTGMVRDVFDEAVVKKYKYDKDFTDKFQGKAKEWAKWQGLSEEQFRYIWRAHWKTPSDTALFDMLHRLRPDRQDVRDWELNNPEPEGGFSEEQLATKPPVVTTPDAKELLEVNDMSPAWVDRMIAISYHPITNSDATRMYQLGYFDDQDLITRFRDNGYTEEDAGTLQEYWKFETNKRVRNQSGVLTPRKVVRLYKDGAIDRQTARSYLEEIFPNADQLDKMLENADAELKAETIQVQSRAVKRSLITGEYDPVESIAALTGLGIEKQAAQRITDNWMAERKHRSKEVTALMLCKWRDRGLITTDEHVQRLKRLGYPEKDAQAIARVCDIDSATRRAKEQKKAAQEALRNAKSKLLEEIAKYRKELSDLMAEVASVNEQLFGTPHQGAPPP